MAFREGCKSFVVDAVVRQRGQAFLWAPVFLSFGIGAYFVLPSEPAWTWIVLLSLLSLAGFISGIFLESFRSFFFLIALIALGFSAAHIRTSVVYTPILVKKMAPIDVSGRVVLIETVKEGDGERITLSDLNIERLSADQTPRKVRINFRKPQNVQIGDRVHLLAGLNPPSSPLIPGGFDFQRHMFFKGIGATGFAYGDIRNIDEGAASSSFMAGIETLRYRVVNRIMGALEGSQAAVVSALMTGHRSAISENDKDAMRHAGLAHMLAISGLHVGLFSGVAFFFVRFALVLLPGFALRYPVKKYAAIAGIMAAIFYMLLAGSTIPTQRAALMSSIVFLAIIIDRSPLSLRLVAFAALCVLLLFPESLLSASFQLSFAAVVALVAFYEWIRPWWSGFYRESGVLRRCSLYVLGVCLTTVIATLATAPFALFHFQQLAVYSLLGNILAMPVLTFLVMPFAVFSFLLMPIGFEEWPLWLMGIGTDLVLNIAHFVSALEHSVLKIEMWPLVALAVMSIGLVGFVLLRGQLRFLAVVPLILSIVLVSQAPKPFLLISSYAKLLAFVDEEGNAPQIYFSSFNKERFTREVWMRSYGMPEEQKANWPKEGRDGLISCGEQGCRLDYQGYKIDVLKTAQGFDEACLEADVIIVQEPVRGRCANKIVIDKFDTIYRGAHAVYIEQSGLRVENSESQRGYRPWTIGYQKSKNGD